MTAHWTAIDGSGCTCIGYQRRGLCTHAIAARTLYERQMPVVTPSPRPSYEDLFHACAAGCGDLVEWTGQNCYACSSDVAYQQRLADKRATPRPFVNGRIDAGWPLNPL